MTVRRKRDAAGGGPSGGGRGASRDPMERFHDEWAAEKAAAAGRPATISTTSASPAKPRGKRAKKTSSSQPSLLDEDS